MAELRLQVAGYPDSDDEERAELASRLKRELGEHGIDEVAHPGAPAPPGVKGGAVEWAQLVVGFAGSVPPHWIQDGSELGGVFQWGNRDQAAALHRWKAIVNAE